MDPNNAMAYCRRGISHYYRKRFSEALGDLQQAAIHSGNIFESLMEACKVCSLGQISEALYQVGGQYRRNM